MRPQSDSAALDQTRKVEAPADEHQPELGDPIGISKAGKLADWAAGSNCCRPDLAASVQVWDVSGLVRAIETPKTDEAETVVSLDSDILFTFGSGKLSAAAAKRIGELVTKVPRAAAVLRWP